MPNVHGQAKHAYVVCQLGVVLSVCVPIVPIVEHHSPTVLALLVVRGAS